MSKGLHERQLSVLVIHVVVDVIATKIDVVAIDRHHCVDRTATKQGHPRKKFEHRTRLIGAGEIVVIPEGIEVGDVAAFTDNRSIGGCQNISSMGINYEDDGFMFIGF